MKKNEKITKGIYSKFLSIVQNHIKVFKSIAVFLYIAMLFSCSDETRTYKKLYEDQQDIPAAETVDFNLTYTLEGNKVLKLTAPLMLDYTNQKTFAYQYFPQKIHIELINHNNGEKTIITADKAYMYKNPELSELVGNVVIKGADNSSLRTSHLFWDGVNKHIFGDEETVLQQNDEQIAGIGFDSSLDFKNVRLNKITGTLSIKNNKDE